jgi:predicted HTH domain antitoxin
MHTLSTDDLARQPMRLLDEAVRGRPSLVVRDGEPLLLAIPMGAGLDAAEVRLELAARLYDRGQISLGLAARLAGLTYVDMFEELGRRGIATLRLAPGELDRELAGFAD